MTEFTHLRIHSEYSLADGSIRLKKLCSLLAERGHKAFHLSDTSMFGAVEAYEAAAKFGLKCIFGHDVHVTPSEDQASVFKLSFLAKDITGYRNLLQLSSIGYKEHRLEQPVPWISLQEVLDHHQGLICVIPELLGPFHQPGLEAPEEVAQQLKSVFKENLYFELSANFPKQTKAVNKKTASIASHLGVPLVASTNAYYLNPEDEEAHRILACIRGDMQEKQLKGREQGNRFHLLKDEEFQAAFAAYPAAIANTQKIADACHVELKFGEYVLPDFASEHSQVAPQADSKQSSDQKEDSDQMLRRLSLEGLEKRIEALTPLYEENYFKEHRQEYLDRLEFEVGIIKKMGFAGYFLIVQDFINWAKEQGIPVGPGRGSGAGSLVAYSMRITDLDPIPLNLVFERFLNPERVSMPDFDIDFCQSRRDEVIKYVVQKYGAESVAQITTFGKMQAKAAIRDVGRALGMPYLRVDQVAKMIPNTLGINLDQSLAEVPELAFACEQNVEIGRMMKLARKLEGTTRHTSVHAAGVIIADGKISTHSPIYRAPGTEGQITQYEMTRAEKVGLIKFDFLGLKTLTVIQKCAELVRKKIKPDFDIDTIPLDDPRVFSMVSEAKTVGVFQLESRGMRQILKKLKPSRFEDIIAMVALFRPGPLGSGMVDDFIERKHGRQEIDFMLPQLEEVLQETYGVILYQEQVQKAAAILASYSLGEADLLRRAMGKKKPEEMAKQKKRFLEGCQTNNIEPTKAEEIFDLMAKFAEYGFNKSHSAAYGLISYQTAYLKALYPEQFMAAIMTVDMDNTDKVVNYIFDLKQFGIQMVPPHLDLCEINFSVAPREETSTRQIKKINYGLGAIKGLSVSSLQPLMEERAKNGPFKSWEDLSLRINLHSIGKKNIELLITAGAMDHLGYEREQAMRFLPKLVRASQQRFLSEKEGQESLFGVSSEKEQSQDNEQGADIGVSLPKKPKTIRYKHSDYKKQKKILGMFLGRHPLELYQRDVDTFSQGSLEDIVKGKYALPKKVNSQEVRLVGYLENRFDRILKSEKKMRSLRLSCTAGVTEAVMFEEHFPEIPTELDQPIAMKALIRKRYDSDDLQIQIQGVMGLEEYRIRCLKNLCLSIGEEALRDSTLQTQLQNLCKAHPGPLAFGLRVFSSTDEVVWLRQEKYFVSCSDAFIEAFLALDESCSLSYKPMPPPNLNPNQSQPKPGNAQTL